MEEKKMKRPTVAQVRSLEFDIAQLHEKNDELMSRIVVLEQSNRLMEAELVRMRELHKSDEGIIECQSREIMRLRSRGIVARILNR